MSKRTVYAQSLQGYYPVEFRVHSFQRESILDVLQKSMESGIVELEKKRSGEDFEYLRRMKTILPDPFEGLSISEEEKSQYLLIDLYDSQTTETEKEGDNDGFIQFKNVLPALYFCSGMCLAEILCFLIAHTLRLLIVSKNELRKLLTLLKIEN